MPVPHARQRQAPQRCLRAHPRCAAALQGSNGHRLRTTMDRTNGLQLRAESSIVPQIAPCSTHQRLRHGAPLAPSRTHTLFTAVFSTHLSHTVTAVSTARCVGWGSGIYLSQVGIMPFFRRLSSPGYTRRTLAKLRSQQRPALWAGMSSMLT